MIKVLARPTNNAEQFCGQRQGGKFKRQHNFCPGWDENFGLHRINLSAFVVCFNVLQSILFCQNLKISSPVTVFQSVLGTRFWSLKLNIGSLESEKIGSLESEKSGPYKSIPGT